VQWVINISIAAAVIFLALQVARAVKIEARMNKGHPPHP
jgi:hypothetical protein